MFETGRVDLCHDHAVAADTTHFFVLAALHVNYRGKPSTATSCVSARASSEWAGRASRSPHRLWRPADDAAVADGEVVLVVLGPDRLTPAPVPDEWREPLAGDAA